MTSSRKTTDQKTLEANSTSAGVVYFLRFKTPLGNPETHTASYYIGWASEWRLTERIAEHRAGRGASITRAAVELGIEIELLMTVPGDRHMERRFKDRHNAAEIIDRFSRGTAQYPHRPTFYGELTHLNRKVWVEGF